jgi:hypothetical protein
MRYILVNDRDRKEATWCSYCTAPIKESYVRDLALGIVYCGFRCVQSHILDTEEAAARG